MPAYVQSAGEIDSGSRAYTSDNTAGNLLVAAASHNSGIAIGMSVSDTQGNIWLRTPLFSQGANVLQVFYAPNCKAGPNTVALATTGNNSRMAIHEYSGVNQLDQINFIGATGTNATPVTPTLIANYAGQLIFAATRAANTTTPVSPWTLREQASVAGNSTADQIVSAEGSPFNGSFTESGSGNWVLVVATFIPYATPYTMSPRFMYFDTGDYGLGV